MKIKTEGNITTVTLTWEEWERQPFPQVTPLMLDHVTRYNIIGVPTDKIELFSKINNVDASLN